VGAVVVGNSSMVIWFDGTAELRERAVRTRVQRRFLHEFHSRSMRFRFGEYDGRNSSSMFNCGQVDQLAPLITGVSMTTVMGTAKFRGGDLAKQFAHRWWR